MKLLALLSLLLLITIPSCNHEEKADLKETAKAVLDCTKPDLVKVMLNAIPIVYEVLQNDWQTAEVDLKSLAVVIGEDGLTCAVSQVAKDLAPMASSQPSEIDNSIDVREMNAKLWVGDKTVILP